MKARHEITNEEFFAAHPKDNPHHAETRAALAAQVLNPARASAAQREASRQQARAEFVAQNTEERFNAWLASMRAQFAAESGATFDAEHKPLLVLPLLDLAEARRGRPAPKAVRK